MDSTCSNGQVHALGTRPSGKTAIVIGAAGGIAVAVVHAVAVGDAQAIGRGLDGIGDPDRMTIGVNPVRAHVTDADAAARTGAARRAHPGRIDVPAGLFPGPLELDGAPGSSTRPAAPGSTPHSPGLTLVPRIEGRPRRGPGAHGTDRAAPPRRVGTPEAMVHATLFLAGDEARFINATGIPTDGGRSQVHHD